MKNDIVEKLNKLLDKNKTLDECHVVYFFVEVRKIIERLIDGLPKIEAKKIYPVVKFYADWCLHIKKDRTDDFREEIEAVAKELNEQKNMTFAQFMWSGPQHALTPLINFSKLRAELQSFLVDNSINTQSFDNDKDWLSFRYTLGKILADQPLNFEDNPVGTLRIKRMSFLPTNPKVTNVMLISVIDEENNELGPYIFGENEDGV